MKDNILVLGAGGFLGRHVAGRLVSLGCKVRLFDLAFPKLWPTKSIIDAEIFEGNFLNPSDVSRALEGMDMVLHFISTTVPSSSIDNLMTEIDTNVRACAQLLELMVKQGVKSIGYPSSGGTVYAAGDTAHYEDEPLAPTCPYGLGKLLCEELIKFYHQHRGIDYQIWRLSNPYGDISKQHKQQGAVDAFLKRIAAGQPIALWGQGTAARDFIFIDDVTDAITDLIRRDIKNEVVNIGSGEGTSIKQLIEIIEQVVDYPVKIEKKDGYTGISRSVLNVEKIKKLSGWSPAYELKEGIAEAWRRLRTRNS